MKSNSYEDKLEIGQSEGVVITKDSFVQMHVLLTYAKRRCIERDVLDEYCREVWYKNGSESKVRFSIGIKNVLGGWELSSHGFKCSTSPKSYSFFSKGSNEVLVFEGMFDMLSWVTFGKYRCRNMTHDIICLNSVVNVEKALPKLLGYERVHLFLDNDSAGSNATALISESCKDVKDYRSFYSTYKDVNEWWCNYLTFNKLTLF